MPSNGDARAGCSTGNIRITSWQATKVGRYVVLRGCRPVGIDEGLDRTRDIADRARDILSLFGRFFAVQFGQQGAQIPQQGRELVSRAEDIDRAAEGGAPLAAGAPLERRIFARTLRHQVSITGAYCLTGRLKDQATAARAVLIVGGTRRRNSCADPSLSGVEFRTRTSTSGSSPENGTR